MGELFIPIFAALNEIHKGNGRMYDYNVIRGDSLL